MKSKVTVKVPRGPKDRGGFAVTLGEMSMEGEKAYIDLFAMPIKPLRLYLEFTQEPERPVEEQIEVVDPSP